MNAGFLVLDKPEGITSHDLVARARRILGTRKIGHAGTLDPMATGLMVLGIESATRLLDYIMQGKKRYLATVKVGVLTSTDDREGDVIATHEVNAASIERAIIDLKSMIGVIDQIPSAVSAIKVDGKRAYQRVRDGEKVELKARQVEIFRIEILQVRSDEIDLDITCSAGTYIRSIARDIGGHLISLRRIEASPFTLADVKEISVEAIIPAASAISKVLPSRNLSDEETSALSFGKAIASSGMASDSIAAISPVGELVAVIKDDGSSASPKAVFTTRVGAL
ncbi:MAG: tRNA pseudouridine(55) synthase TruB [Actinomycetota bacterium]